MRKRSITGEKFTMKNVMSVLFILTFYWSQSAVASDITPIRLAERDALIESQSHIAKQDYKNALNALAPFVEKSLEAKFLTLELTNPDYRRSGVQNWSTDYERELREVLFNIENVKFDLNLFANEKDFHCAVLQSYIYELVQSSDDEKIIDLSGVSTDFFSCLGRVNATFFTTYAPLLIWDVAKEVAEQDRSRLAKTMYQTAIDIVMLLQGALTVLNYDVGKIDGKYGNKTYSAFVQYQLDTLSKSPTGTISLDEVLVVLNDAKSNSFVLEADKKFLDDIFTRLALNLETIEAMGYFSVRTTDTRGSHLSNVEKSVTSKLQSKINTGLAAEMTFWNLVQVQNTEEFYQAYLDQYPNGTFTPLAELLIQRLLTVRSENINPPVENNWGKYKVLIIANEEYDFWENLRTPIQDQSRISAILATKYGMEVKEHTDLPRKKFLQVTHEFFTSASPSDNLIFYYAGHGERIDDAGFWLPVDAEKNRDFDWINIQRVQRYAKASKAKNILFLVDSCFSGIINSSNRGLSLINLPNSTTSDQNYVRVAISSGQFDEPSLDVSPTDKRYSPFARAIYDSLYEFQNNFTSASLFSLVSKKFPPALEQRPNWGVVVDANHTAGDFKFLLNMQ